MCYSNIYIIVKIYFQLYVKSLVSSIGDISNTNQAHTNQLTVLSPFSGFCCTPTEGFQCLLWRVTSFSVRNANGATENEANVLDG